MTDAEWAAPISKDWKCQPGLIPRQEMLGYLELGMTSEQIADCTNLTYTQVCAQIRTQITRKVAKQMRYEAKVKKVLAAWENSNGLYRDVALTVGVPYTTVCEILQKHRQCKRVNRDATVITNPQKSDHPKLQPGDFVFQGKRVTVRERDRMFTTAWVDGQWQVFNSCEVREV